MTKTMAFNRSSLNVNKEPQRILASAVASLRIEGLELDARSISDFQALASGKVSTSALRSQLLSRYSKAHDAN
jgi:hypothetical protein